MQIETLKVFCDVVRLRSFSKGAQANSVTQSMASQTLTKLEKHLNVSLIDRSFRPWKITPEGKVFYDGCRDIVDRYERLETQLKHYHDERTSIVHVASVYSVGLRHMNHYIEQFSQSNPQTKVHLDYLHPDKVYESVIQEDNDLGIVSFPQSKRELNVIPWRQEPMVLACHPQHPLASESAVNLEKIHNEKFVAFDDNLVIRREVDRFLKQHDVNIDVVLQFDNIESIKRAVEIASGVSILPRPTLDREILNGSLVAIPFASRELIRPLGIIHRRGRKFNNNILNFIQLLQAESQSTTPAVPVVPEQNI